MNASIDDELNSSNNYITRHYIMDYLNDSIQQLLETKNVNGKIDVVEFFREYFKSVVEGTHVLFREYNYVVMTPQNRACFVQKFFETYNHMISRDDLISPKEYHALISLLSYDFPYEVVENIIRNSSHENGLLFKDFIYSFQFQFYYKEFVEDLKTAYENPKNFLKKLKDNSVIFEVTGSSSELSNKHSDPKLFLECVNLLEDKQRPYNMPPVSVAKMLEKTHNHISLIRLFGELAKNEIIIKEIDKLPSPDKLLESETILKSNILSQESKEFSSEDKLKSDSSKGEADSYFASSKFTPTKEKSFVNTFNNRNNSDTTSSDASSDTDT